MIAKSFITAYDFEEQKEADVSSILYDRQSLWHLPASEAFPYPDIRIALTGSFQAEREYVLSSVRDLRKQVEHHSYNFDQMVDAMQMVASSRFRYSAPLVP